MKVCFDTDVLNDIVGATDDMLASFATVDVCFIRGFEVYVSAGDLQIIDYVAPKKKNKPKEDTRKAMSFIMDDFKIIDVLASDCKSAYASDIPDFKDAILERGAARSNVDLIITRNKSGFERSDIPVMTPKEFLEVYKPPDIKYSEVNGLPFIEYEGDVEG